jgi:hypothetical protein
MYKLKTKAKKHSINKTSSLTTISSSSQQTVRKIVKIVKFKNLPIKNYRNQQQLTKNWGRRKEFYTFSDNQRIYLSTETPSTTIGILA